MLYGRAGYLYALLFVQKHVGRDSISSSTVVGQIQQILETGAAGAQSERALHGWGLMYQWHGSQYLGGCHGLAGQLQELCVLFTLLCASGPVICCRDTALHPASFSLYNGMSVSMGLHTLSRGLCTQAKLPGITPRLRMRRQGSG